MKSPPADALRWSLFFNKVRIFPNTHQNLNQDTTKMSYAIGKVVYKIKIRVKIEQSVEGSWLKFQMGIILVSCIFRRFGAKLLNSSLVSTCIYDLNILFFIFVMWNRRI